MTVVNTTFSKLYNEDKTRVFRLKVEWEEDNFKLFVLDSNNAWSATVTTQTLTKLGEQHDLSFLAYMETLRGYICNTLSPISITIASKNPEFIIYRHIEAENLKLKYFVIRLKKLDYYNYVEEALDFLTLKCEDMSNTLLIRDKQIVEAKEQRTLLEHKLEELTEIKAKSDHHLYSAVALVLNEKKNRIQFLTELLESNYNGTKPCVKPSSSTKQSSTHNNLVSNVHINDEIEQKPSTSKRQVMSDSESSASGGYETDEEKVFQTDKMIVEDLGFLGSDSPPSSLIPKRLKSDKPVTLEHYSTNNNQASTSFNTQSNTETTKNNVSEENSQASHFDTQDLLDMM